MAGVPRTLHTTFKIAPTSGSAAGVATTPKPESVPQPKFTTLDQTQYEDIQAKYGSSLWADPYSGKPLLTYENPELKASQLLSDRTWAGFDPSKPQKIDPKILQNGRMPESVSQKIKSYFPGSSGEELDHVMPLELGGSNELANLRLETFAPGAKTTPTDPIENQLAVKAHQGEISLVDAWRQMAKAKGIQLPEDVKSPVPSEVSGKKTPSDIEPTYETGAGGDITKAYPETVKALAELQIDPISSKVSPAGFLKAVKDAWENVKAAEWDAAEKLAASPIQVLPWLPYTPSKDLPDFFGKAMEAAGGIIGAAFAPIGGGFTAMEQFFVPLIATGFKLFNLPFKLLGGDAAIDTARVIVDNLPLKQVDKNKLIAGAEALVSAAGSIAAAGLLNAGEKRKLVNKFGEKDAKIIENKAVEISKTPPELGVESETGVTLYGEAFPGAKYVANFVSRDILSRIKDKILFIRKIGSEIKNAIIPDVQKERVRSLIRQSMAEMAQTRDIAYQAAENMINWWDKIPEETQAKFLDSVERGRTTLEDMAKISVDHAEFMSDVAKSIREKLDVVYEHEKDAGSLAKYVEDYLPHLFERPEDVRAFFEAMAKKIGKSPYFEKPRVIDLISTAKELGFKLKTANPERLVLMRQFSSFQFLMEQNVLNSLHDWGLLKATEAEIPARWKAVDETVSKSFAKRESLGKGRLIAPEHAANLLNNWLSPSLWSKKGFFGTAFRDFMAVKNQVVAIKLGLSLFHGVMTGISSMATQLNKSLFVLADTKNLLKFLGELSKVPAEPFIGLKKGGSIVDAWYKGAKNEYEAETIALLKRGGFRPKMSAVYRIGMESNMNKAIAEFKNENPIGGIIRMIPEIAKAIQKPLMDFWVPRIKTDATVNLMREFYENFKEKLTEDEMNVRLGQIVDHMDNLFGQMIYDNLFWRRWMRDLGIGSSLSLGWNLGTVRDFGGALTVDAPRAMFGGAEGRRLLSRERLLSSITYPLLVGAIGGLMTYAFTGKRPDQLLDYYYPRDGTTNPDGSPGRIQIPAETKEFFSAKGAIQKKGIIGGVGQYLWHKTNPTFATTMDLLLNKDFYGVDIRDENSPAVQQAIDVAKYLATEGFGPISVSGAMANYQTTGKFSVMPFLGFTPAPKYVTETSIQSKIYETYDKRLGGGTKSKEEGAKSREKSKIRQLYLQGKIDEANRLLDQAVSEGVIKEKGRAQFIREADIPGDVKAFNMLPATDQEDLLSQMSLDELRRYAFSAKQEVRDKLFSLSANAGQFVDDYTKGLIEKPIWEAQRLQN